MINRVVMVGRLTRDPELRTTTNGKSVVNFSIAVGKRIKPTDGSPDADFFTCIAWERSAEYVANYLTKGRLVGVEGRLQSRKYQTKEGQDREVVEIVCDNVQGLDRPKDDAGVPAGVGAAVPASAVVPDSDEYDPFADE